MSDSAEKRIGAIDLLRGIAVLGILFMNIQTFSMVESAYFNPTSYGDFAGLNAWTWGFTRLFADQKFMTIFSVLFGAGIVLMAEKAAAHSRRPWALHYRRMFVLLGVGLAHAYLLWYGDILTIYALCGIVLYWLRKWRPSILFSLGIVLMLVAPLIFGAMQYFMDHFPAETMAEFEDQWRPDAELIAWELGVYRGDYWGQMEHRAWASRDMHTMAFITWLFWRVSGLMLIGMALFKWKVLGAYRSPTFYKRLALAGLAIGLSLEAFGMYYQHQLDWDVYAMIPGMIFNFFSSLFVAAAYVGLVMLMHQRGRWPKLQQKLANVGRMAFTNYLAQTLICTTVFYGHGLGLFGYVERWQQLVFVAAVLTVQVAWSSWWLARFQYGPLEWLWRCATYLRVVPLRRQMEPSEALPPVIGITGR